MSGFIRRTFHQCDLVKVDTSEMVIHATGGPLMTVECIEGENAVCSWEVWPPDWSPSNPVKGYEHRRLFPLRDLRRLTPY